MIRAIINGRPFFTMKEISILEACKLIGIKVPRFCYQENLSIAGNCRMCLVEIVKVPKPIASCAVSIEDNMVVNTVGPFVLKARANILESLLLNHPLDCPICDQGGECDLQDQSRAFGNTLGRQYTNKRGVEDKVCDPLIKTIMTRCIHCTRCVRFTNEICNTKILGTLNRGTNTEIGNYIEKISFSGIVSNVVDLCPVGALTFQPSAFQIRPWEVKSLESIDLTDGLGSNIYINYKELDVIRVLPKKNTRINMSWVSDKGRFSFNPVVCDQLSDLKTLFHNFSVTKRILFLVNSETDLETLNTLQHIAFLSKNKVKIRNFSLNPSWSNYYFWSTFNKVYNISTVNTSNQLHMLISSNLKVESVLLNVRVRANFFAQNPNIYSLGNAYSSNFPIFFFKLNVNYLLKLLSGKSFLLTKLFLKTQVFMYYGKAVTMRLNPEVFSLIKRKIPTLQTYTIHTYCNAEGINFSNIACSGSNLFQTSDYIYKFFVDDTISLRKKNLRYFLKTIQFTNFKNLDNYYAKTVYISPLNKEGIFLNLEQRPQKGVNIINFFNYTKSLKYFLQVFKEYYTKHFFKELFNISFFFSTNREKLWVVLNEVLQHPDLFDTNKLYSYLKVNSATLSTYFFYNNYPIKLIIHDFFRTNNTTKHSLALLKVSKKQRAVSTYNYL